jgi:hypothetical protein
LSIALPKAEKVNFCLNQYTSKYCRTYVRMVLRQHTPSKLKRLLLQHKSILELPKLKVRDSKIAHCLAWSKEHQPPSQLMHHTHRTYVRMVFRQHTPPKLKRLLLHHKSVLMPSKCRVRDSKIAH